MIEGKEQTAQAETPQGGLWDRFLGGDRALWIIVAFLAVASLLVVYSSTASMAYRKAGGDTFHYFLSQLKFILLGFGIMVVVHRINYQVYGRFISLMFLAALGFMLLTFVIGVNLNSASRWIRIPIVGLTFQPSDFLRVALVLTLARQLDKRQKVIDRIPILPAVMPWNWKRNPRKNTDILLKTTIPLLGPVALACGAIFFSNFSTAAITFITCWMMLYIGRVRVRELWRLILLIGVVMAFVVTVMATFHIGRAGTWVNRLKDFAGIENTVATNANNDDDLQKVQAKIAIASGGIVGKGPGHSTQRSNLPHSYSDFAYAFIVEEYGLIGAVVILFLYLCLFFRGILTVQHCGTAFPSLMVLGLTLMITLQAVFNMLVSVGIFPVTGQTLPLVSLGGSSIIFNSLALGMVLGVSRQMKDKSLDKP